jgi:hypothetical protein
LYHAPGDPYDAGVPVFGADFYGEVLKELVVALGAALFVANLWALVRRRADARDAARQAVVRGRPGSPVRKQVRVATTGNLAQAPLARTVTFMVLGLAVAIWGIASLTS